jgi:hypothetical protein
MAVDAHKRYITVQISVTRAVLKFCEDHKYAKGGLSEVRNCLCSLERVDITIALEAYERIPLGGRMGYFDDWIPEVVCPHETPEHLQIVFNALLNEWDRVMKLAVKPNTGSTT